MLQHAGAGNRALLGNVADEKDRRAARLGKAHQLRRALAQLADRTRRGRKRLAVKRLNRIDHQHRRLLRRGSCQNTLNLRFAEQHNALACQSQPLGAQPNLARRLLAAHIQTRHRLRQMMHRLQQQCGLADARIATNQHHTAAHQPAAENTVKLADAARHQRLRLQLHRIQPLHLPGGNPGITAALARARRRDRRGFLLQRVPGAALVALPLPFRIHRATIAADKTRLSLGH